MISISSRRDFWGRVFHRWSTIFKICLDNCPLNFKVLESTYTIHPLHFFLYDKIIFQAILQMPSHNKQSMEAMMSSQILYHHTNDSNFYLYNVVTSFLCSSAVSCFLEWAFSVSILECLLSKEHSVIFSEPKAFLFSPVKAIV